MALAGIAALQRSADRDAEKTYLELPVAINALTTKASAIETMH